MKKLIALLSVMGVALVAASAASATQEPEFVCPPPGIIVETSETVNNGGDITNGHTHYVCIIPGQDGEDGTDGATGPVGPQGPIGPQGPAGANGNPGTPGTPGTGSPGASGPAGSNGSNGTNGRDGLPGLNGKDGTNGLDADICANLVGAQPSAPAGKVISLNPRGQLVCVTPSLAKSFVKYRVIVKVKKVTIYKTVVRRIVTPKPDNPPVKVVLKCPKYTKLYKGQCAVMGSG